MRIGIDIGSTTIKCVVLDEQNNILHQTYERHYAQIKAKTAELLETLSGQFGDEGYIGISGSAGMGIGEFLQVPFAQEVFATKKAVDTLLPGTDVVVELGGEDAKILFLTDGMEMRMNGSCAGGTGAFIDQIATLLGVETEQMDELAAQAETVYTIASRCGVFAKSDIQPLLNQGVNKADLAISIFWAVVNQTIAGLAQGRTIAGKVVYLGGPITFMHCLQGCFDKALGVVGICPSHSLSYVAMGAALLADRQMSLRALRQRVAAYTSTPDLASNEPLFATQADYDAFALRHRRATVRQTDSPVGALALGIDAGSTTVKAVAVDAEGSIAFTKYMSNSGNPVTVVRDFLTELYQTYPDAVIGSATTTGYGEELIKQAFCADFGVVETVAHFTAAKTFMPDVEFVIDIGGQDIKCFRIEQGVISDIFLNEACSSGCGSFLQTFAQALGYQVPQFAQLGLFAEQPVDLGSRCTVFMNSSVKQAQKDGASIANIAAGLSISVVKNAIYKVIRVGSSAELGKRIVVQGGTFYNDAVLRAFEKELGIEVVRPEIAGLMGAYGAALYGSAHSSGRSSLLTADELERFDYQTKSTRCGLCGNSCQLMVNIFDGARRFVSGNRCEKPLTQRDDDQSLNLYEFKRQLLASYPAQQGSRGKIGIPMVLNLWELYPFWYRFFTELGFEVVTSPPSSRRLYLDGQGSVPSDTVCFPAKLAHGHIEALRKQGVDTIFYPCMTYNLDEGLGDNHYNCPVVAYYPETIAASMSVEMIYDYIGLHRRRELPAKLTGILGRSFAVTLREVKAAVTAAFAEYDSYLLSVRARARQILAAARQQGKPIILLAGRPYHADREVNHGIDQLIAGFGAAVVSEDGISDSIQKFPTQVLNQWTYHSRLYAGAKYACDNPDVNLVQLVSFGCGVDAITADEVKRILTAGNKIYTQLKIDEITNLGAVKIRLRSLFAALQDAEQLPETPWTGEQKTAVTV